MKQTLKFFAVVMARTPVDACNTEEGTTPKPKSTSINKIRPLGASRVQGFRPQVAGYCYELWKALRDTDWVFDFTGRRSEAASYPAFDGGALYVDRAGRGGFTSGFFCKSGAVSNPIFIGIRFTLVMAIFKNKTATKQA